MTSDTIIQATQNTEHALRLKVYAYSEAYIFVLEAQKEVLKRLSSQQGADPTKFEKTMEGSYLRLVSVLGGSSNDPAEYYRSILFVDLISSFEQFFIALIKSVLLKYPHKVGKIQFTLKEIVETASTEELVEKAAENFIYKLMYESPQDYLEKMCDLLAVDGLQLRPYWPKYVEAKARRDLGVHNNWICNDTYMRKVTSVGGTTPYRLGERIPPLDKEYCASIASTLLDISSTISKLVIEKYPPSLAEQANSVKFWEPHDEVMKASPTSESTKHPPEN
jgi:hypothetical protein